MACTHYRKWTFIPWGELALFLLLLVGSAAASAQQTVPKLQLETGVVSGYSNCTWVKGANGNNTVSVTMRFNQIDASDSEFLARGVIIYLYDVKGKLILEPYGFGPSLGGSAYSRLFLGEDYLLFTNISATGGVGAWANKRGFDARVTAIVPDSVLKQWPAVAFRAANLFNSALKGEDTGVYILPGANGGCQVVKDLVVAPPLAAPRITFDVTAPDWNLGVVPRGFHTTCDAESPRCFNSAEYLLCFTTTSVSGDFTNTQFVIKATNAQGTRGEDYLLRLAGGDPTNPAQSIPYKLLLTEASGRGSTLLPDPNVSGSVIPLLAGLSKRTCFVPTFMTSVSNDAKDGVYFDVLTFTVVAKP